MKKIKINFLQDFYSKHLETINGIRLTKREIDVLSFFVCGRSAKKFAAFFNISPKTVENHTHNIMLKFGCNSREGIIDFIEKSDKLFFLRSYYKEILVQSIFYKYLNNFSRAHPTHHFSVLLTFSEEENNSLNLLISHLETSLKYFGASVSIKSSASVHSVQEAQEENYIIYIGPHNWSDHCLDKEENTVQENKNCLFLFLPHKADPIVVLKEFDEIDFLNENLKNYYFLFFDILKHILPSSNLEKIISEFQDEYKNIEGNENWDQHNDSKENHSAAAQNKIKHNIMLLKKKKTLLFFIFCFSIPAFIYLYNVQKIFTISPKKLPNTPVRSELDIPIKSARIERLHLMAKINERFKGWNGIQTIALVGVEGAGKTTLARQYAASQELPNIWEINAESQETLNQSFENLAYALSETEEDKKLLRGILKIEAANKYEEKIVQFVKERLKTHRNWFLIYDNVDKFTDILNYFPKDQNKWGQGRVIVTTRDGNIENNNYINNVIYIGELTEDEKFNLFIKIMNQGKTFDLNNIKKKEIKKFLLEIPPFPLDVSVAAYYLKATHVPYKNYLENTYRNNKDFLNVQEKILQGAGNYTKTRYGILTLTLTQLMQVHDDFQDLLFFISRLDSQNITRDLLVEYKGDAIVDSFIYHLNLYSLINYEPSKSYGLSPSFSIHRSIQNTIFTYLTNMLPLNKKREVVSSLADIIESHMSEAIAREDFAKMKILYRHAEQLLNHTNLLSDDMHSSLLGELGCICYYLCSYAKAKQFLGSSILKLNPGSKNNYSKLAHFKIYLGNVHRRLGHYEKAKEFFEQGIQIYKKLPEPNVNKARAFGCLGIAYESLGYFEKAKALLEESLMLHKKQANNPIGIAWSLAHLGSIYVNLGNYEKAIEVYKESFLIYSLQSKNHVGAAWVCGDLGNVYTKLKDYKKAKEYLESSLTIYDNHFNKDHIYVAYILADLGMFYGEVGNYEKAKNLLKKALVSIEMTYGKDHSETGITLASLAKVYLLEGRIDIAEDIIARALAIYEKNRHPNKYEALEILAEINDKKAKLKISKGEIQQAEHLKERADVYLTQALQTAKIIFPKDSPHIQRIQMKLKK